MHTHTYEYRVLNIEANGVEAEYCVEAPNVKGAESLVSNPASGETFRLDNMCSECFEESDTVEDARTI